MSSKYEFIDGEKANYRTIKMCRWAQVSTSGFYEWRGRPASATTERRAELTVEIRRVFVESDETYGYRRVHEQLQSERIEAGPELVRQIMRAEGLVACQPKPYKVTTVADGAGGPVDLCERDFTATAPGVKLVGDITYIRSWQGWVYLATVIDCHSRVGDGRPHAYQFGDRRVGRGPPELHAERPVYLSLGSWFAVHIIRPRCLS